MAVSCEAGWNGGHEQQFTLHVQSLDSNSNSHIDVIYNNSMPFFGLPSLEPGRYLFIIGASNLKGSSPTIKLKYSIGKDRIKSDAVQASEIDRSFFSWIFVAVAVVGLLFIIICTAVIACLVLSCKKKVKEQNVKKDLEPFLAFHGDKEQLTKLPNIFISDRKGKLTTYICRKAVFFDKNHILSHW